MNLHFTTVSDVRRSLFALRVARRREKFAFHDSFGRASDEPEVTRGLSPAATYQTYPAEKKRRNFKEEQHFKRSSIFEEQPFSAALLSSFSQQLFSAAFLSSSSQQPFSAALLSSLSQQLFSAAFLSSYSQQPFSAALLSSLSQQLFSTAFSQQPSQQLFSAALLSNPFSAIILVWSGVGGQLACLSQQLFQQLLSAAFFRGFLSSLSQLPSSAIILLWSGVGGQLGTSSCCGQGLVVS